MYTHTTVFGTVVYFTGFITLIETTSKSNRKKSFFSFLSNLVLFAAAFMNWKSQAIPMNYFAIIYSFYKCRTIDIDVKCKEEQCKGTLSKNIHISPHSRSCPAIDVMFYSYKEAIISVKKSIQPTHEFMNMVLKSTSHLSVYANSV